MATSSKAAHTPGPWEVGKVNGGPVAGTIPVHTPGYTDSLREGWLICSVYGTMGRSEANARLIAAAPDLLAALEALTNWGRDNLSPVHNPEAHQLLVAAHNAIARARGEQREA